MMQKGYENRYQVEMISIEDLVPQEHLLRQIGESVDFSKIYDFVEELYCDDNGRPSIDPVVLFKIFIDGTHIYDCIICPEYQVLDYRTTNRDGYKEYKSNPEICKNCSTRHLCTESKDCVKAVYFINMKKNPIFA